MNEKERKKRKKGQSYKQLFIDSRVYSRRLLYRPTNANVVLADAAAVLFYLIKYGQK